MNPFIAVCNILYASGIFPKAFEYPTTSVSNKTYIIDNNFDFSTIKLDTDMIPVYRPEKELTNLEKEKIANRYNFTTGYSDNIFENYVFNEHSNNIFDDYVIF